MLFNSYVFVLAFLPICVIGWFLLNRLKTRWIASVFLLAMSLLFYGWFNVRYLPVIISSVLVNYIIYRLMRGQMGRHEETRHPVRKLLLALALLFNLGMLFYYKYYDFFFENVNALFGTDVVMRRLLLPLGISFFTFQQLSFVIDTYRGETPEYRFLDYALFVTFFPQLIAGPIVTHDELVPQFQSNEKRRFDWNSFSSGLYLFALGLGKKVLIADTLGSAVAYGFENISSLSSASAIVVMLSYTFQIYFDFSGYCDMATGAAKMLNIDLPLNFDSPYKALTITDFWRRWHITLTRFLRKYVYFPLGGSQRGKARTYLNILIVYLVSGLWHGANWTFVLWGAMHGVFVVVTRAGKRFFDKLHPVLNWLITFTFINITWLFFRADTASDAWVILRTAFGLNGQGIYFGMNPLLLSTFTRDEVQFVLQRLLGTDITQTCPYVFLVSLLLVALFCSVGGRNARQTLDSFRPNAARMILAAVLLVWCITSFTRVSVFLYFNF